MLDLKFVAANPDVVRDSLAKRGVTLDLDEILRLDGERRALIAQVESIRNQQKNIAKEFQKSGGADSARAAANELRKKEGELSEKLTALEATLEEKASWLPNVLDPRVPVGDETKSTVLRKVGEPPNLLFKPRSHEELGKRLNLIDVPRGVTAAKSRFYCLKNEAVRLRYALIQMFFDNVRAQGWELVCPPYMAKRRTLYASGYLPFADKDNFKIEGEDLSLIGTSEQALLGIHLDEVMDRLPVLYLGDSMCFRTEAGSYGKDTAGILRVHQFYKLEQIVYCHPDESEKWHLQCLENSEQMMRQLGIPYQVVLIASGDLGAPGRIKYDTEAWFPSQGKYRETTSNTNLGDYQTRRGNIRFKVAGQKGFPHTISATGFCDRLILAILENCQQEDGSVVVPDKLRPYLGTELIRPR